MTTNEHTRAKDRARTALATVAVGAALVLAACGTTQALSGTSESGQRSVIRDPDNPYWTGMHASDGVVSDGARTVVIRDPDNPYWSNPDAMRALLSDPSADPDLRGPR
jgi:hypothetical protein